MQHAASGDDTVTLAGERAGAVATDTLVLGPEHVVCSVRITAAPTDESLARVVGLLTRTLWSVFELHHRRGADRDVIDLVAYKSEGRIGRLVAALRREVVVIDVEQA
jgi:hypothetical protein